MEKIKYEITFIDGTKEIEEMTYRQRLMMKIRKNWSTIKSVNPIHNTKNKQNESNN